MGPVSTKAIARRIRHVVLSGDLEGFDILLQRLRDHASDTIRTAIRSTKSGAGACTNPDIGDTLESLSPADFVWSNHPFNAGAEENALILRAFEDEHERRSVAVGGDLSESSLLMSILDLAGAYIKNYSLDKASLMLDRAIDECRSRGAPWDIKCLQDMATLRFKQNRQRESAELLEELAARSPPHPALQENLVQFTIRLGSMRKHCSVFRMPWSSKVV